jgi:hypothetical protein
MYVGAGPFSFEIESGQIPHGKTTDRRKPVARRTGQVSAIVDAVP